MAAKSRHFGILITAMLALGLTTPAQAERTLIIANDGYSDSDPGAGIARRASQMSAALQGFGYAAKRLTNPTLADVSDELDILAAETGAVVIYYAGRTSAEADETYLLLGDGTDRIALSDLLAQAGVGTRDATIAFLDICADPVARPDDTAGDAEVEETVTATMGAIPTDNGLFMAGSVGPGATCEQPDRAFTETLRERLELQGLPLEAFFLETSYFVNSTLAQPFFFGGGGGEVQLTAEDYAYLDTLSPTARDNIIAIWQASGIAVDRPGSNAPIDTNRVITTGTRVLTSPVRAVSGGTTLAPVSATPRRIGAISRGQEPATTPSVAPTPAPVTETTARPVPGTGGLPEPSIIVGLLNQPIEAGFGTTAEEPSAFSGETLDYRDLENRRSLREDDPELFGSLVDGGAFDPPDAELIVALQTELQRMNCYNAGIDGAWGPGSRRSVARYFEQIGEAAPSQEPTMLIFRQIMLRDDVTCPAIAQPVRQPQASTPRQQAPRQQAPRQQPAPQAAPTRAPQTSTPPRTINRNTGTGIFR
ncbi:caspase family protein [Yoonia sp. 2307UL14-13]|uniref:caspase family protein n=1 Tax=Yoonia sp. 2307UL14-13 TaxID=3126506 RepID=UPI0030B754D1